MNRSTNIIAVKVWLFTWLTASLVALVFAMYIGTIGPGVFMLCLVAPCLGSLPALVAIFFIAGIIRSLALPAIHKTMMLSGAMAGICLTYGAALLLAEPAADMLMISLGTAAALYACTLVSVAINYKTLMRYMAANTGAQPLFRINDLFNHQNQTNQMDINSTESEYVPSSAPTSNKVLVKAVITGVLILIMLIPTLFIINLVEEREGRQREVIKEVAAGWATSQTITGPYLVIPYTYATVTTENKPLVIKKNLFLLPEDLTFTSSLYPQERKRSIYTVLLYRTNMQANGRFVVKFPSNFNADQLLLNEARICIGVDDFKGIEEKVSVNFNDTLYELSTGLPSEQISKTGLSAGVRLSRLDLAKPIAFNFNLKVKGSENLSFVPLSGNSSFRLNSIWPSPSFNGANLPTERQVSDSGFSATWMFNKANVPFSTFLTDLKFDQSAFQFGVSMLQPADQYSKTMRCVKYAILFIGLTFSLFFIVELMQHRPVHPVQYILVGLALVIFYTLLLSISEFLLFDYAYLIAATATVSLITVYAKGHFKSWKVAGVFSLVTGLLYTFIFILIRLEDTALLVGSVGLFTVLALVMYASRNINWYNPSFGKQALNP